MLKLTRTGIGLLTRQYRSVLHKCWLINVGLWQAMGDAVSKAVSVPARLIASLLSGGALNGEAFNVLDEILLSRLFERKLASLTAIGLTVAAATMPSEAEAGVLCYDYSTGTVKYSTGTACPAGTTTRLISLDGIDSTAAIGENSTAVGNYAQATKNFATAIGFQAYATGDKSTVLGAGAQATVDYSTALGYLAKATGNYSTAVGINSTASGAYALALGNQNNDETKKTTASSAHSIAIGTGAQATGSKSTALGYYAEATVSGSMALGNSAQAYGENSTALGNSAQAYGKNSTALGNGAQATRENSTALGNGAQATSERSTALGSAAQATKDYATAIGREAQATGSSSTALGYNAQATGAASTALGSVAQATKDYATAIGREAQATENYATALGYYAKATGESSIAIGNKSVADEANTVSFGYFGADSTTLNQMKYDIDHDMEVTEFTTKYAQYNANNKAEYLYYEYKYYGRDWDQAVRMFNIAGEYRRITNVADAVNAHDAVTLGQLQNNYYRKLMKKDEKFATNKGIMDVKSLKKGTNSSQGRIIKGVSAFPSIMCAYPFDMPHTANDNHKNVIVRSAFKPSSYGKRSATIGSRPNQFAEILVSSTRMTGKESIKMTENATTTKQAA